MIRTAIPFGYCFICSSFVIALVAGVALSIRGLTRRRYDRAFWLGIALMFGTVVVFAFNVWMDSRLEWNPTVTSDRSIVGTWQDAGETLLLNADHTFTYDENGMKYNGSWSRSDWNLYLEGNRFRREMRIVLWDDDYRIWTSPPEDPDMWDGNLGLSRNSK